MKQTDFRDVPDELWEHIEPLLAPFRRKRNGGSRPLPQRTVLAGILYKYRSGCKWAMFPPVMAQKALSMSTSNAGAKPVSWQRFFAYFSQRVWREGWRRCPMASYGRHLAASPDALSKNQRLRASDATRQTEGEVAARSISMWMVRVFLWE